MTKLSDYPNERLTEPNDDDYVDVSIEISPSNYQSQKMKWSVVKAAISGTPILLDVIPVGDGSTIIDGPLKAGELSGDGTYISNVNQHTTSNYYGYHDSGTGNSWLNGASEISFTIAGSPIHMKISSELMELGLGSTHTVQIGNSISSPTGAKVFIVGRDVTSGNFALDVAGSDELPLFRVRNDGSIFLENGTGVNEIVTGGDYSSATDDQLGTRLDIKTYFEANSSGGWLGSETRIKIAPWDIVSYNDKDGVSIQDDGGVVNDAAAKITTMVTGVFIPTGLELFESQVWDSTAVSKGSGNANTEINITNVNSTATNYLSIIIVEAGNDIYGGYITIEKI